MNYTDDDDAPPMLVDASDAPKLASVGIESQLTDLSLVKVPITIVTGTVFSSHSSKWSDMPRIAMLYV